MARGIGSVDEPKACIAIFQRDLAELMVQAAVEGRLQEVRPEPLKRVHLS
jgi:hypothetical protein